MSDAVHTRIVRRPSVVFALVRKQDGHRAARISSTPDDGSSIFLGNGSIEPSGEVGSAAPVSPAAVESNSIIDPAITMSDAASNTRDIDSVTNFYEPAALDLTFLVSCHNESEHIVRTLDTICTGARRLGLAFEVVVIDDVSSDNSVDVVRQYIAAHPGEAIILRANRVNKGLAQNYLDGAFIGRGKYYRLVCGDSPESVENVVNILSMIGEADCIVPHYRSNLGRRAERRFISGAFTFVVNKITGNQFKYYNGLAVHLRRNVMRWHTNTKGFGFQAEILCLMIDNGFTFKEIEIELPVSAFTEQDTQSGALNMRNFLSVVHTVVEIASRRISRRVYGTRRAAPNRKSKKISP